jgi:hypothetical protein
MKTAVAFALLCLSLFGYSGPASAEVNYPWCVIYGGENDGGAMNCGFVSLAQCQQTRVGTDMCVPNPLYRGPSPAPRRPPARS